MMINITLLKNRYGPPPSYPNLKIPGLNAPIPDGCRYPSFTKEIAKKKFMLPLPALVITLEVGANPLLTSLENLCMEMSLALRVNFPNRLPS